MPELPHAYQVLVLGIASIASCFCFGIIGLACGIAALVYYRKAMRYYLADPYGYRELSINNLRYGRTLALVGLLLSGLYTLFLILYYFFMIHGVSDEMIR
ncbi:MAG: DUF4190 domain-containing protein [Bacteroidetes bacterium]|nr:MAG: DUF4190 domain-containing protein [Bacteroidota bacterium]